MPWTMAAFAIGALSMIGLPPTAGFMCKWYMLSGAMAGAHWVALAVIVGSTLLNAGYFLPIVYRAFFRASTEGQDRTRRSAVDDGGCAGRHGGIGTVLLFFFADVPLALARQMVAGG